MTMRSPERVQYIIAGLTKSVWLASSAPASPHMRAGDDEADQLVAVGRKADRAHARVVRARALDHQAEARIDQPPDQIDRGEQQREADVIELHLVRQIERRDELAALVDGQPVVAAVARQPGDDVIGHLREGQA